MVVFLRGESVNQLASRDSLRISFLLPSFFLSNSLKPLSKIIFIFFLTYSPK